MIDMLGIFEHCGRCGRKLKTDKSRLIGYGPTCKKIVEQEEVKLQVTIDEVQEGTEYANN